MKKEYLEITVYEALQKRFEYIFQTFDNICLFQWRERQWIAAESAAGF